MAIYISKIVVHEAALETYDEADCHVRVKNTYLRDRIEELSVNIKSRDSKMTVSNIALEKTGLNAGEETDLRFKLTLTGEDRGWHKVDFNSNFVVASRPETDTRSVYVRQD